jgi:putative glutathione S-transferase
MRALKRLESVVSVSVVEPLMLDNGWEFSDSLPDHLDRARYLYEIYIAADSAYTGRVTVPVLWDKQQRTIVNNESAEIIRMLDSGFGDLADNSWMGYPQPLRGQIDQINDHVYEHINNGVYKAGFASTQAAYDEAIDSLFEALDRIELRLEDQPYLVGETLTEADWRLFTTLIRFDPVYAVHFKCSRRRIVDYPALWHYTRRLYAVPGVAGTVSLDHIRRHYYGSHKHINPSGLIAARPANWLGDPVTP